MSASLSSVRVVPATGAATTGIGKYRYIAVLDDGGMATVYVAVTKGKPDFEKLVVIKELHAELAEDPTFVELFIAEAKLAARLNHPNVVQTHEVGSDEGRHFIAMELLEGVTYGRLRRLRDGLPAPLAIHVRILADVLYGLHYAHELRDFGGAPLAVVHRDVSPGNVMLTYEGGVKVLDFGIAKAAFSKEVAPDDFKGKLEYMAPEQALLEEVDRRADVFSVGVMLFEAITRQRFWEPGADKYARLIGGEYPHILDAKPDAPKKLVKICEKALARNRDERFRTAQDMAHELEEWLDGTTQHVRTRDIGAFVSQRFETTREKLGKAIAAQVEVFRALPEDSVAPVKRLPLTDVPPTFDDEAKALPPNMPPLPANIPANIAGPPANAPTLPSNAQVSAPANAQPAGGDRNRLTVITKPRRAEPPRMPLAMIIAAIAMLVAIGVVAILIVTRKKPGPSDATAATATPPDATEIDITVRVFPADARVLIDGQAEPKNPVVVKRKRDGAMHAIRAEAAGFLPREERFAFDRNLVLMLDLQPLVSNNGIPAAASASNDPKKKPVLVGKPKGKKPFGLDTENPY